MSVNFGSHQPSPLATHQFSPKSESSSRLSSGDSTVNVAQSIGTAATENGAARTQPLQNRAAKADGPISKQPPKPESLQDSLKSLRHQEKWLEKMIPLYERQLQKDRQQQIPAQNSAAQETSIEELKRQLKDLKEKHIPNQKRKIEDFEKLKEELNPLQQEKNRKQLLASQRYHILGTHLNDNDETIAQHLKDYKDLTRQVKEKERKITQFLLKESGIEDKTQDSDFKAKKEHLTTSIGSSPQELERERKKFKEVAKKNYNNLEEANLANLKAGGKYFAAKQKKRAGKTNRPQLEESINPLKIRKELTSIIDNQIKAINTILKGRSFKLEKKLLKAEIKRLQKEKEELPGAHLMPTLKSRWANIFSSFFSPSKT